MCVNLHTEAQTSNLGNKKQNPFLSEGEVFKLYICKISVFSATSVKDLSTELCCISGTRSIQTALWSSALWSLRTLVFTRVRRPASSSWSRNSCSSESRVSSIHVSDIILNTEHAVVNMNNACSEWIQQTSIVVVISLIHQQRSEYLSVNMVDCVRGLKSPSRSGSIVQRTWRSPQRPTTSRCLRAAQLCSPVWCQETTST